MKVRGDRAPGASRWALCRICILSDSGSSPEVCDFINRATPVWSPNTTLALMGSNASIQGVLAQHRSEPDCGCQATTIHCAASISPMHRRPEPTQVAVLIAPLTFSRRNAVTPRDDGQGMINTQFGLVREGEYMRPTFICSWMSAAEAATASVHPQVYARSGQNVHAGRRNADEEDARGTGGRGSTAILSDTRCSVCISIPYPFIKRITEMVNVSTGVQYVSWSKYDHHQRSCHLGSPLVQ